MGERVGVGIVACGLRGAGYGGLPCSPRAPGGVRGLRRGEARRPYGEGRLSFLEPLRLRFDGSTAVRGALHGVP
jgi:hypothetical protein